MIFNVYSETFKMINRVESIETTAPTSVEGATITPTRYTKSQSSSPLTIQAAPQATIKNYGRNDKVSIEKNGEVQLLKWKKAQELVKNQGWKVIKKEDDHA